VAQPEMASINAPAAAIPGMRFLFMSHTSVKRSFVGENIGNHSTGVAANL
jgi:hypothetical protein